MRFMTFYCQRKNSSPPPPVRFFSGCFSPLNDMFGRRFSEIRAFPEGRGFCSPLRGIGAAEKAPATNTPGAARPDRSVGKADAHPGTFTSRSAPGARREIPGKEESGILNGSQPFCFIMPNASHARPFRAERAHRSSRPDALFFRAPVCPATNRANAAATTRYA